MGSTVSKTDCPTHSVYTRSASATTTTTTSDRKMPSKGRRNQQQQQQSGVAPRKRVNTAPTAPTVLLLLSDASPSSSAHANVEAANLRKPTSHQHHGTTTTTNNSTTTPTTAATTGSGSFVRQLRRTSSSLSTISSKRLQDTIVAAARDHLTRKDSSCATIARSDSHIHEDNGGRSSSSSNHHDDDETSNKSFRVSSGGGGGGAVGGTQQRREEANTLTCEEVESDGTSTQKWGKLEGVEREKKAEEPLGGARVSRARGNSVRLECHSGNVTRTLPSEEDATAVAAAGALEKARFISFNSATITNHGKSNNERSGTTTRSSWASSSAATVTVRVPRVSIIDELSSTCSAHPNFVVAMNDDGGGGGGGDGELATGGVTVLSGDNINPSGKQRGIRIHSGSSSSTCFSVGSKEREVVGGSNDHDTIMKDDSDHNGVVIPFAGDAQSDLSDAKDKDDADIARTPPSSRGSFATSLNPLTIDATLYPTQRARTTISLSNSSLRTPRKSILLSNLTSLRNASRSGSDCGISKRSSTIVTVSSQLSSFNSHKDHSPSSVVCHSQVGNYEAKAALNKEEADSRRESADYEDEDRVPLSAMRLFTPQVALDALCSTDGAEAGGHQHRDDHAGADVMETEITGIDSSAKSKTLCSKAGGEEEEDEDDDNSYGILPACPTSGRYASPTAFALPISEAAREVLSSPAKHTPTSRVRSGVARRSVDERALRPAATRAPNAENDKCDDASASTTKSNEKEREEAEEEAEKGEEGDADCVRCESDSSSSSSSVDTEDDNADRQAFCLTEDEELELAIEKGFTQEQLDGYSSVCRLSTGPRDTFFCGDGANSFTNNARTGSCSGTAAAAAERSSISLLSRDSGAGTVGSTFFIQTFLPSPPCASATVGHRVAGSEGEHLAIVDGPPFSPTSPKPPLLLRSARDSRSSSSSSTSSASTLSASCRSHAFRAYRPPIRHSCTSFVDASRSTNAVSGGDTANSLLPRCSTEEEFQVGCEESSCLGGDKEEEKISSRVKGDLDSPVVAQGPSPRRGGSATHGDPPLLPHPPPPILAGPGCFSPAPLLEREAVHTRDGCGGVDANTQEASRAAAAARQTAVRIAHLLSKNSSLLCRSRTAIEEGPLTYRSRLSAPPAPCIMAGARARTPVVVEASGSRGRTLGASAADVSTREGDRTHAAERRWRRKDEE